jgi:RNA polymerase sigma-70 factor (ECF subfamily)
VEVPSELIERLQNREPGAFEEFFGQYGDRLLNFGFRMCGDREDAREVLQETLLKTFESIGTLKNPGAFAGWLYRIAHNACLMRRRHSKFLKEEVELDEALPDPKSAAQPLPWNRLPDQAVLDAELRERLRRAILDLPEGYRSVLVLRDIEGLDTESVASALGLNRDVVKMRLHRARGKVRNMLESYLRNRSTAA